MKHWVSHLCILFILCAVGWVTLDFPVVAVSHPRLQTCTLTWEEHPLHLKIRQCLFWQRIFIIYSLAQHTSLFSHEVWQFRVDAERCSLKPLLLFLRRVMILFPPPPPPQSFSPTKKPSRSCDCSALWFIEDTVSRETCISASFIKYFFRPWFLTCCSCCGLRHKFLLCENCVLMFL